MGKEIKKTVGNKKAIIILAVIAFLTAAGYFGYEYYKQQQAQEIIAYYNNIDNFKEFAVEGADEFKLENYHVSPPDYNDTEKIREKLKEDLLKLHPIGSDYRALIYTLLKKGGVRVYSASKDGSHYIKFGNKYVYRKINKNKITYQIYKKIKKLKDYKWHVYWGTILYDKNNKVVSSFAFINAGKTRDSASGTMY